MSAKMTNKIILLFLRGAINVEIAKTQIIQMYEKSRITKYDFKRAINLLKNYEL